MVSKRTVLCMSGLCSSKWLVTANVLWLQPTSPKHVLVYQYRQPWFISNNSKVYISSLPIILLRALLYESIDLSFKPFDGLLSEIAINIRHSYQSSKQVLRYNRNVFHVIFHEIRKRLYVFQSKVHSFVRDTRNLIVCI